MFVRYRKTGFGKDWLCALITATKERPRTHGIDSG